jgi:hypothetical protein
MVVSHGYRSNADLDVLWLLREGIEYRVLT